MKLEDRQTTYPIDQMKNKKTQYITNDHIIRIALMKELNLKHAKDHTVRIIEELGVNHGNARVDIAVVNGVMHGYEIKSDADTLYRLPEQINAYSAVFDRITIVVGFTHIYQVIDMIPNWWGITVAKNDSNNNIVLNPVRLPEKNTQQDSTSVARLLWKEEALDILTEYNAASGLRSKPRNVVYQKLASIMDKDSLEDRVRETLFTRQGWRSACPTILNGG